MIILVGSNRRNYFENANKRMQFSKCINVTILYESLTNKFPDLLFRQAGHGEGLPGDEQDVHVHLRRVHPRIRRRPEAVIRHRGLPAKRLRRIHEETEFEYHSR